MPAKPGDQTRMPGGYRFKNIADMNAGDGARRSLDFPRIAISEGYRGTVQAVLDALDALNASDAKEVPTAARASEPVARPARPRWNPLLVGSLAACLALVAFFLWRSLALPPAYDLAEGDHEKLVAVLETAMARSRDMFLEDD